jgi:hypothetical protein
LYRNWWYCQPAKLFIFIFCVWIICQPIVCGLSANQLCVDYLPTGCAWLICQPVVCGWSANRLCVVDLPTGWVWIICQPVAHLLFTWQLKQSVTPHFQNDVYPGIFAQLYVYVATNRAVWADDFDMWFCWMTVLKCLWTCFRMYSEIISCYFWKTRNVCCVCFFKEPDF